MTYSPVMLQFILSVLVLMTTKCIKYIHVHSMNQYIDGNPSGEWEITPVQIGALTQKKFIRQR